jgi:carbon-monoxide dehydrogenase large subunit
VINPMLTLGQVQGGLAQGIGQALLEHTVYDERSGQLLSGSLMDYALPRADDLPPLDITLAELPTAVNPLGVKGAGQAGCIAAPQTIVNAILDALSPLGIEHIDMPATPERVWRAIRTARQGLTFSGKRVGEAGSGRERRRRRNRLPSSRRGAG